MAVKDFSTAIIDGVSYQVLPDDQGGLEWSEITVATPPGPGTPEEQVLSDTPATWARKIGFLDWSMGCGLPVYRAGDRRLHWSEGPDGSLPNILHRGLQKRSVALTGGAVSDFFEINGALYVINGDYVRKITPTLNAETIAAAKALSGVASGDANGVLMTGLSLTEASPPWYDGATTKTQVYIGATGGYMIRFDGVATWTQAAGAGGKYTYWTSGKYSTGPRLWASGNDANGVFVRNLPDSQDPFDDTKWSARLPVTNRNAPVTAAVALRDSVVAATQDGMLHSYSSVDGSAYPLVDQASALGSSDAGKHMRVWNGMLVVPTPRGLQMYQEDFGTGQVKFVPIGPSHLTGHQSPVTDYVTALCAVDGQWLFASFYNGTDSYIWKARLPLDGENAQTRLIWQPVKKIAAEKVTALHLTHLEPTVNQPILCVGTVTPNVHFITLPRPGKTVLSDSNCRSETSAEGAWLPDHDKAAGAVAGHFRRVRIGTHGMSDTEYVNVYCRVDGGPYALIGTVTESPTTTIVPSDDLMGYTLGIKLEFVGSDSTVFPYVTSVEIDFTPETDVASWADAKFIIAPNQLMIAGETRLGVYDRKLYLRALADDGLDIDIVAPDGVTYTGRVDPFTPVTAKLFRSIPGVINTPAWVVACRLNLYDDLTPHQPAIYEVSPYSTGTVRSYYGTF